MTKFVLIKIFDQTGSFSIFHIVFSTLHSVEQWKIWSHQKKTFRQINYLVISLVKTPLISRNFCQKCEWLNRTNFHSPHCALWRWDFSFLNKNSVKSTSLLSKYPILITANQFHEIFLGERKILVFEQKFREIIVFTK